MFYIVSRAKLGEAYKPVAIFRDLELLRDFLRERQNGEGRGKDLDEIDDTMDNLENNSEAFSVSHWDGGFGIDVIYRINAIENIADDSDDLPELDVVETNAVESSKRFIINRRNFEQEERNRTPLPGRSSPSSRSPSPVFRTRF
jgi:hypothetical protein